MKSWILIGFTASLLGMLSTNGRAASGSEGAAFLDIPVGAGPAALGAAYTALSNDAYAATYNPSGLGFLPSTQFSGQHLSYLDSLHYEYMSFAVPLHSGSGIGGSVQYLGSGDITGRDDIGNLTGNFSSYFAAYNLAFGHAFTDKLSLGLTGKIITGKIADVSAAAYAADLGTMYLLRKDLTLAATVNNIGSKLTFLDDGDPLPLAFHLGAAYQPLHVLQVTTEIVARQTGLIGWHMGTEWHPVDMLALRAGYKTDTTQGLSPMAGVTVGAGLQLWGQELAYAFLPYGDLGDTHYISLLLKFGETERARRNLIQYQHIKSHGSAKGEETTPDEQQMIELLNNDRTSRQAQGSPAAK